MANRRSRIYLKHGRYYGDFRDYADVGGKREALTPEDCKRGTTDEVIAQSLADERLKELERKRRNKALGIEDAPAPSTARLGKFAEHHLMERAKSKRVTDRWLQTMECHLRAAVEFFGTDRPVGSISTSDVRDWLSRIWALPNGRGGTLSRATQRKYLNSLSNLYRRAQSEGQVPPGYNPVSALMDKPVADRAEARWLEVHEASLLLEACRAYKPTEGHADASITSLYPVVATLLLTGGRKREVLGLEISDISFERRTVVFRPNEWRPLKTSTPRRVVPLWPQLEEILREYLSGPLAPTGRLLFPSSRMKKEVTIKDLRKALDAAGALAGWKPKEIRTKMLRHTYCAARLQTLEPRRAGLTVDGGQGDGTRRPCAGGSRLRPPW